MIAMVKLQGRLVGYVDSAVGKQADIILVEPNGDQHPVRCLVRQHGTQIDGDGEMIDYLNERYSPQAVCSVAKWTVLQ